MPWFMAAVLLLVLCLALIEDGTKSRVKMPKNL